MPDLLRLEGVNTHIGQYHILQGVDFVVPEKQLVMLLGRNGAGKTTCLRTIMGLWRASAGNVFFDGKGITRTATPDLARLGIAYVPENMGIFAGLTVRENLLLAAREGDPHDDRLERIFRLFPAMKTFWHSHAGNLSGGQKQMLAVSRAIVEPRRLLLIDEPTKGLAPIVVEHVVDALVRATADATVLLVEQNLWVASHLAQQAVVLDHGTVAYVGGMAALADDPALAGRYLGVEVR